MATWKMPPEAHPSTPDRRNISPMSLVTLVHLVLSVSSLIQNL